MVTNEGLVVQQTRSAGGVSSELSGACSGQGLVAEHNTEDSPTVFVACTKRLPKSALSTIVDDGYMSQDILACAVCNPFAFEIARLYCR